MKKDELIWKAVGAAAGALAAAGTRRLTRTAWRQLRGGDPPTNPAARDTTWAAALSWAVASGVALAVSRLVAQRGAAAAWRARTGSSPPGLETVG